MIFGTLTHKAAHVIREEFQVHIWNSFAAVLIERTVHILEHNADHIVEIFYKALVIQATH